VSSWRSFPFQIFGLIVLPLTAVLLVIAFGSLGLHQRAMRNLVGQRDERAARAAAAAIGEQMSHRAMALDTLARQLQDRGYEAALAGASPLLDTFDGGLAVFDADGALLAANGLPLLWESAPVTTRLAQMAPAGPAEPRFLEPLTDPLTGEYLLIVAGTTADGGILAGAFYPATVARRALTTVFDTGEKAAAFVVTRDGHVLVHVGELVSGNEALAKHAGVAEALAGASGTTYVTVEDDEHVVAYSFVEPVGWALVLEESWHTVADPTLNATEYAPLVLAPALVITIVAIWFGVRQVVRPLQSLAGKATELGWGRFDAINDPVGGIAEIRHLQSELIRMAEKVKAAQQGLRGYLGAVTAGQEEERRRLARELHDDTLQSLIALNQRVQLAQLAADGHPAGERLAEIQRLAARMIADLRRYTQALRPIYLEELGLAPALEMLARETARSSNIPVTFQLSGTPRRLPAAIELALYRIAQEALSNVVRHAAASQASVQLAFTAEETRLTVADDGRGFAVPISPAAMAPSGHFGLLGLHERAELIAARVKVESQPGAGTRVTVTVTNQPATAGRIEPAIE
jgi:signal transduction histidine kinase